MLQRGKRVLLSEELMTDIKKIFSSLQMVGMPFLGTWIHQLKTVCFLRGA